MFIVRHPWITTFAVVFGILLLICVAVPEPIAVYINNHINNYLPIAFRIGAEPLSRLFAGLFGLLLAWPAFLGGREWEKARVTRDPEGALTLGEALGSQRPYRSIAVYRKFPSFATPSAVLQHVVKSIILANYKPVLVELPDHLATVLDDRSVVGVVSDAQHRHLLQRLQEKVSRIYLVKPERSFRASPAVGRFVDLTLANELEALKNISRTAQHLAHAHATDVIRAVGFHGTWATTYGFLALREDLTGSVSGVYWYGSGIIKDGRVEIDDDNSQLLTLRFTWSQKGNTSGVGSDSEGDGVFILPAGYETFYGYWHVAGEPEQSQPWNGTRLSHDVIEAITAGGMFSKDFGRSFHNLSNIIDPRAIAG
jgi:hypothetical protein